MNIDYKSIIFNNSNLKIILYISSVAFALYFSFFIIFIQIYDYFSYRIDNKYSYEIAIEYIKGNVQNPYSFYRTSLIYRNLNKFEKEKTELLYAKELLYKNTTKSDLEILISSRLKELEELENFGFFY